MRCSAASVASTLAVLLGRTQANPALDAGVEARVPNEVLHKRNVGGVYMCTDINWGGECQYDVYPLDECWEVTGDFYYTISSFGVDEYTLCSIWYDNECSDNGPNEYTTNIAWPGRPDMRIGNWNDAVGSFRCEYYPYTGGE